MNQSELSGQRQHLPSCNVDWLHLLLPLPRLFSNCSTIISRHVALAETGQWSSGAPVQCTGAPLLCSAGRYGKINWIRLVKIRWDSTVYHRFYFYKWQYAEYGPLWAVCTLATATCRCANELKWTLSSVSCAKLIRIDYTVKLVLFACPIFREFRDLGDFGKIKGRKYILVAIY